MSGVIQFIFFVVYFVVWFVIYRARYDVIYFDRDKALVNEIIKASLFAVAMDVLTMKLWVIAVIVIVLVGLGLSAKCKTDSARKVVIILALVMAVLVGITGYKFNHPDIDTDEEVNYAENTDYENIEEDNYITNDSTEDDLNQSASEIEDDSYSEYEDDVSVDEDYEYDDISNDEYADDEEYEDTEEDSYSDESIDESETDTLEYILPYSDSEYLTDSEVEDLSAEELRLARNEIYARHGRLFKDELLQEYFDSCSWYEGIIEPDDFNDEAMLNDYEKYNRDLIKQYENK